VPPEPIIRRGSASDAEACHSVLWASVTDFGARNGTPLAGTAEEWWKTGEPLHRFLAEHAAEWWVAEDRDTRELIGFARSIERGRLLELTEFFVLPTAQSRGVGRKLIERAFPIDRGDIRSIIATTDSRAMTRYYAAGTVARFPLLTVTGVPTQAGVDADLIARRVSVDADFEIVRDIEGRLLEYARNIEEIRWFLDDREGYLYLREREPVGYGFIGKDASGPIGTIAPEYLPEVLLHIENRAASLGAERLELQVPAPNEVATRHLLDRGFRIDAWINLLMSNRTFGQFDRFLGYSPPVFL